MKDFYKVVEFAQELLVKHKLHDWKFKFSNSKSKAGLCNYTNKIIYVSKYLVEHNSFEIIKEVVLHELAHAIVGRKSGHSNEWKETFIGLGGSGKRYLEGARNFGNYNLICLKCDFHYGYSEKPSIDNKVCKFCNSKEFKVEKII